MYIQIYIYCYLLLSMYILLYIVITYYYHLSLFVGRARARPRPMCGGRGAIGRAATQTRPNTYTPSRIEHTPHVELVTYLFLLQPHCSILIKAFGTQLY